MLLGYKYIYQTTLCHIPEDSLTYLKCNHGCWKNADNVYQCEAETDDAHNSQLWGISVYCCWCKCCWSWTTVVFSFDICDFDIVIDWDRACQPPHYTLEVKHTNSSNKFQNVWTVTIQVCSLTFALSVSNNISLPQEVHTLGIKCVCHYSLEFLFNTVFTLINMRGGTKVVPPILVSEITITIIIKFTYIMDIQFTNLRLFFHNVSFIMNTVFLPLRKMLYVDHWKLFDRASKISMHTVF